MIPPLVRGATLKEMRSKGMDVKFPMIPPLVRGATSIVLTIMRRYYITQTRFPMIPPLVRGATFIVSFNSGAQCMFPMIPPLVRGATSNTN